MLAIEVRETAVVAKLGSTPAKLRDDIASLIERSVEAVAELARDKLSGEVLNEKTGRLKASIAATASGMTGRITSDAPYARIEEYGGRIEVPDIVPRAAKALAFEYEGKLVFAKHAAAHAVSIPERSYLRNALAESAQTFVDGVRKVVTECFS